MAKMYRWSQGIHLRPGREPIAAAQCLVVNKTKQKKNHTKKIYQGPYSKASLAAQKPPVSQQ